jgi:hypothetical protein
MGFVRGAVVACSKDSGTQGGEGGEGNDCEKHSELDEFCREIGFEDWEVGS